MIKTLQELDKLAQENDFGGAHNAITCAITYRQAYSEYLHKYKEMIKVFDALKEILPLDMMKLIERRLEEES